jgi:hypothetical protein
LRVGLMKMKMRKESQAKKRKIPNKIR